MNKQKYSCKQAEFYITALIGWRSFLTNIGFFTAFKAFYTVAFQAACIAQINAARALPDVTVRNSKVKGKLLIAKKKGEIGRNQFQMLKSYIDSAFEEDVRKIKYKDAGIAYYSQASNNDWEAEDSLLVNATAFISANLVVLTTNNNMPPAFQAQFATAVNEFNLALSDFYNEETFEKKITENKTLANNQVYDVLIQMCEDTQEIFRKDDALKSTFTFEYLVGLVSNKVADISGDITTNKVGDKLQDFEIRILETDDFGVVAAGTYTVVISKDGFITQTIKDVVVLVGTQKMLSTQMLHE